MNYKGSGLKMKVSFENVDLEKRLADALTVVTHSRTWTTKMI